MARLIEIRDVAACPSPLTVRTGDVLLFHARGARVVSGADAVELLGAFAAALLADNGEVLSPEGPPSTVLVRTRRPGGASVAVISGDPFHSPRTTEVLIAVRP